MLKRIYDGKLIHIDIKKNTMHKLIKDTCKKTAFSFENIIYNQIDDVSMRSHFAPVLANIIMTELEKTVVQKLTTSGMIKFYSRYVDDAFLLVKPADIPHIHNLFNEFDKTYVSQRTVPHFFRYKNLPTWTNNLLKGHPHRPIY